MVLISTWLVNTTRRVPEHWAVWKPNTLFQNMDWHFWRSGTPITCWNVKLPPITNWLRVSRWSSMQVWFQTQGKLTTTSHDQWRSKFVSHHDENTPLYLCSSRSYDRLHFGVKTRPLSVDITSQRYLSPRSFFLPQKKWKVSSDDFFISSTTIHAASVPNFRYASVLNWINYVSRAHTLSREPKEIGKRISCLLACQREERSILPLFLSVFLIRPAIDNVNAWGFMLIKSFPSVLGRKQLNYAQRTRTTRPMWKPTWRSILLVQFSTEPLFWVIKDG